MTDTMIAESSDIKISILSAMNTALKVLHFGRSTTMADRAFRNIMNADEVFKNKTKKKSI